LINYNDLEIRDAEITDLPEIVNIYNSTVPGRMVTADTEPVTVESREKWFYEHSPNFRPLWVMKYKGEMCGWLSFQSFYGRPAYNATVEVSIYINEMYRKHGLGRFILEKALAECPKLGIKTVLGFIFGHNKPSLNLFYSFGFVDYGNFPGVAKLDGIERDLIIVGKRLL
jgi:L-amino acid N-acyltransferase YncA